MTTAITVPSTKREYNGTDYAYLEGFGDLILKNAVITASGQQQIANQPVVYNNVGARQLDLLIDVVGAVTGTNPTLQFEIDSVLVDDTQAAFGAYKSVGVVQTYLGASITTGAGTTDTITVVNNPIGDFFQVRWTIGGTSTPTFNGVYARLVWKK